MSIKVRKGRQLRVINCVDCGRDRIIKTENPSSRCRSCASKAFAQSDKHRELCRKNHLTHGKSNTPLYHVWENMKARCKPSKCQNWMDNWYLRGIRVCDLWQESFSSFADWAIISGYAPGLLLDREDNDGNYTPENCRWITRKESQQNRRPQRKRKDNTSGVPGVHETSPGKFVAAVYCKGVRIRLGTFNTLEAAASARTLKLQEFHC